MSLSKPGRQATIRDFETIIDGLKEIQKGIQTAADRECIPFKDAIKDRSREIGSCQDILNSIAAQRRKLDQEENTQKATIEALKIEQERSKRQMSKIQTVARSRIFKYKEELHEREFELESARTRSVCGSTVMYKFATNLPRNAPSDSDQPSNLKNPRPLSSRITLTTANHEVVGRNRQASKLALPYTAPSAAFPPPSKRPYESPPLPLPPPTPQNGVVSPTMIIPPTFHQAHTFTYPSRLQRLANYYRQQQNQ